MRRTVCTSIFLAIAVALSFGSVACSSGDGSVPGPTTSEPISTVTTCNDFTDPPFNYVNGEHQEGFDPDFLRAASTAMGATLRMSDTRFSSLIAGLQAGRCNAITSFMYITPERAKVVDLIPYAESGAGFLVRQASGFRPQELTDLCGHPVSTLQGGVEDALALSTGSLGQQCAAAGRPIAVRSLPTGVAAVQDLVAGRVDAFFMDNAGAVAFAEQYRKDDLVVSNTRLLAPVVAGIAVAKGDARWRSWFTEALRRLTDSGELRRLYDRYGLGPVSAADVDKALAGRPAGSN
ncbi:transporter substrate-binding domain-containing protein [Pseudonocardia spinosispora]|uniref:transporter substrate-binding domain-containing protein n=1 Tax=Pseudonocardia spinosispora TaxID=103441 RepID=UPI00040E7B6A|nr:transporter substrate-binding domain-containing protein [Pseudonocardia spinosispora]